MSYRIVISGIYTIKSLVDDKIYVGKAINIAERLNNHRFELRQCIHKNKHLQHAWNKYGESNFEFELLEECNREYLCSQEHYWCIILDVHNDKYGYNIGLTNPNCTSKVSKESLIKRTTTRRINSEKRGYWVPESHRIRLSINKKGKPVAENMLIKSLERTSKKVMKLDLQNRELAIYKSMAEAGRLNKTTSQAISLVCKGKQLTAGGFKWKIIIDGK